MSTKKYVSLEKLGLYNEKINKVITDGDAAVLAAAKAHAEGLGVNYDAAGAAATALVDAKAYADGKDASIQAAQKSADDAAAAAAVADGKAAQAQSEVDALEAYVGTFTASEGVDTVVKYIDAKTANIASDETVSAIADRVTQAEKDIDAIEKDYLKAADKTEIEGEIAAVQTAVDNEKSRAEGIESGLDSRIKVVEDDYLKAADKTELQGNIDTLTGVVETLRDGVDAEKVDGVKDLIAYVEEHGTEVTGMQDDIAKNAEDIAGVSERMGTAEGKITSLETTSATHATKDEVTAVSNALSEYKTAHKDDYTNAKVDEVVQGAIDAKVERVDAELAKKVDKVDGKGLSTNDLTNDLKANYDAAYAHSQIAHAPAGAQANVIESVKVNGTALTITDKSVDITVPTKVSELTNDSHYLVAADVANKADKSTTLSGYGITDAYTTAQTDTAIANAMANFVECSETDINNLFTQNA